MSIDELEQQKVICDLFVDGFNVITAGAETEFKALENAKLARIQQCYSENMSNYDLCQKEVNVIKACFLGLEFQLFLETLGEDNLPMEIIERIKRISMKKRNYSYFRDLGLVLNPEFKMDPRTFFANYKIAKKKAAALERQIEFQRNNGRGPLL